MRDMRLGYSEMTKTLEEDQAKEDVSLCFFRHHGIMSAIQTSKSMDGPECDRRFSTKFA